MKKDRVPALGAVLAAGLAAVSCQRLDMCPREAAPARKAAPAAVEPARVAEAIPADYGTPIGVTQDPSSPQTVRLWFQKPDGTLIVAFMDVERGKLSDRVLTIPRK
jgi:hypothetical protein